MNIECDSRNTCMYSWQYIRIISRCSILTPLTATIRQRHPPPDHAAKILRTLTPTLERYSGEFLHTWSPHVNLLRISRWYSQQAHPPLNLNTERAYWHTVGRQDHYLILILLVDLVGFTEDPHNHFTSCPASFMASGFASESEYSKVEMTERGTTGKQNCVHSGNRKDSIVRHFACERLQRQTSVYSHMQTYLNSSNWNVRPLAFFFPRWSLCELCQWHFGVSWDKN